MYGIATNVVGDDLRRYRRQQRIYLVVGGLLPKPDDPYQQADEQLIAAAVGDELNRALGALRTGDRNVFLLYAIESLTYQETADALGILIGTVRSRLPRARRTIRELIPDLDQVVRQLAGEPQPTAANRQATRRALSEAMTTEDLRQSPRLIGRPWKHCSWLAASEPPPATAAPGRGA